MAIRQIIEIDEGRCDGCGACETGCPEGALRIIDGKARLVGESLCDGLGACIGACPRGAITVTRREAEPYDEEFTIAGIARQGPAVLEAHLEHLARHGQTGFLAQAVAWMETEGIPVPAVAGVIGSSSASGSGHAHAGGCPSTRMHRFTPVSVPPRGERGRGVDPSATGGASALTHWPIQLHLVNPGARQYRGADLLVAADCTAFSLGAFHEEMLAGRALVIACPKLDQGRDQYVEKLAVLLGTSKTVTVAVMEVPCCSGLLRLVLDARDRAGGDIPVHMVVIGIEGGVVTRKRC